MIKTWGLFGLVGCLLLGGAAARQEEPLPNFIFIIVDDMGYYDTGCYGSKTIRTPNIDRLAEEGMRFTDAYSGATVCAPARCILMTGFHMGHASQRGNRGWEPILDEDVTIAEVLAAKGYVSGGFGKWGMGDVGTPGVPEKQGFQTFFGYYHQVHAHDYYTDHLFRNSERVPNGRYTQYPIFEESVKFIRENRDKPFFCYLPWTPPHAEYQFPEDDPVWEWYRDRNWPDEAKVAAAMDSMVDRQVGEIMGLLKELEIDDRTVVFFCSDNGAAKRFDGVHNSSGEMTGFKRSVYEGGIRTPFIVRWPGRIAPGTVSDLPTYFPDIMPTLAELSGTTAGVPEGIDGLSIVPTLLGEEQAGRKQEMHEYLFWEFNGSRAVRMGNWKGVRDKKQGFKLFDLSNDLGEKNDLASENPEVAEKINGYMEEAWQPARPVWEDPTGTYQPKQKTKKKK